MTEGLARLAGARLRTIALMAVFCALTVGPGCGTETFDLLNTAGNAGSQALAGTGAAGDPDTFGGGGNGNEPDAGAGKAGMFGEHAGSGGGAGLAQAGSGGNPAGCLAGEPCASSGVICPPNVSFCEHCSGNDCDGNSDSPYCSAAAGRCVQCQRPNDCAPDELCYPFTLRCAHVCITAAQCADDHNHPVCDTQFGVCVACTKDTNCRAFNGHPAYCAFGSCVECKHSNDDAASAADVECPEEKPYCVGLRCQNKPH